MIRKNTAPAVQIGRWLVILIMALGTWANAQCPAQILSESMSAAVNTDNLSLLVLEDPARALTIEQVMALPDSRFEQASGNVSSATRGGGLWLRLCLQPDDDAPTEWLLTLLPAYIEHLELYRHGQLITNGKKQGFAYPFSNREYDYRGFVYRLNFTPSALTTYHLKLGFYDQQSTDVMLLTPEKFQRFMAIEYVTYGLYLGMVLLAALINFIFWYRLRDRDYLLYAVSMILLGAFSSISGGYASQFVFSGPNMSVSTLMVLSSALFGATFILFLQGTFRLRTFYRYIYYVTWGYITAFLLTGVFIVVAGWRWLFIASSVITSTFIVVFLFVSLHALIRHRSLRFYAVAFLPLQVALLLLFSKGLGLGGWIPLIDHLPNIGGLIHVVLLNFALARRAWQAEQDKFAAKEALLQQVTTHNLELESKVQARTLDLGCANIALTKEIEQRASIEVKLRESLANEKLALQTQKEFVAMVSHEFRSPLAVIDMVAQNLQIQLSQRFPEVVPRIQRIRNNTERMTILMNNCLTSERLATDGAPDIKIQSVDVCQILERLFAFNFGRGRIELVLPKEAVISEIDPELLAIAWVNVVENALKYSPEDTKILVQLCQTDSQVYLQISDRGPGIDPNLQDKIFDKFYRAPNVQTQPGSGIGLYLAKTIVEQHGGNVTLLPSEGAELGCCFQFQWPVTQSR
ncbi:sensor histidine kinase [Gilvimarinus agarilyticus]|uniref:sensor histidine kinase n=1 Tax=Gilvimarinus sp. 2_MG-2023 TaxID=3062666 RepID=UPI001C092C87|nr:sensor histidine kinase [Gilvimarinus sp. 2_MG-2023]MBU2886944.1 sensor histidine kinase [Gilvimarinus agarilyticus]MDO6571604.1 sensor histidine kinase [Gilvimarinus sp. 2_MG-2023]